MEHCVLMMVPKIMHFVCVSPVYPSPSSCLSLLVNYTYFKPRLLTFYKCTLRTVLIYPFFFGFFITFTIGKGFAGLVVLGKTGIVTRILVVAFVVVVVRYHVGVDLKSRWAGNYGGNCCGGSHGCSTRDLSIVRYIERGNVLYCFVPRM